MPHKNKSLFLFFSSFQKCGEERKLNATEILDFLTSTFIFQACEWKQLCEDNYFFKKKWNRYVLSWVLLDSSIFQKDFSDGSII